MKEFDLEEMQRSFHEYMQKKYPGVNVGMTVRTVPLDKIEEVIKENKRGTDKKVTKQ